MFVILCKKSYL